MLHIILFDEAAMLDRGRNNPLASENSVPYPQKQQIFYNLATDLESFLERRFPSRYVSFTLSAAAGSGEETRFSTLPVSKGSDLALQLLSTQNVEPVLELTLRKNSILLPDGEWVLDNTSGELPAVLAHRFIEEYLKAQPQDRKPEIIATRVLRDGDVLLTVDRAIEGWCTHPRGILVLRQDGIFLDNNRISEGELVQSPPDNLEVIPSGIVFESKGAPADILQLMHRDLDGNESTIFAGYRKDVASWRPHPEGVAIESNGEVRVNGKTVIFKGDLPEVWGVTSCGRVVTVSLSEHHDRQLPGGKGCFRPAGYASFLLEGGECLYEAKYQWLEEPTGQWHQHADIRMTGYGIFVKDSPEWRFFERYETWEWHQGLGFKDTTSFGDEWSFFEVLASRSRAEGLDRGKYEPEAARLLWRPDSGSLFDWMPSIESGATGGVIVREGNSFVFRSNLGRR